MKLATYKDGSRDGQLVVVSRDLTQAHYATHIANRLQQVLDDWNYLSPQLQDVYDALNNGRSRHAFAFAPQQCMAPLPRAYQWASGAAYASHTDVLQRALGGDAAASEGADARLTQGASDSFAGPCDPIVCANAAWGVDFAAELAVVTGDIPMGCPSDRALDGIRLIMLANAVHLRQFPGAPSVSTSFSPVAVTPDELGDAWSRGRVQLPLQSIWNGRKVGMCDAGADMALHFGQLVAQLCQVRPVRAGSIVGSGVVSNKGVTKGTGAKAHTEWPKGYHCIAEKRAMETLQDGQPSTAFMQYGDTIRIDMKGHDGHSIFGAIEQEVVMPNP